MDRRLRWRQMIRVSLGLIALIGVSSCAASQPAPADSIWIRLAPCPDSPNCVSTVSEPEDGVHYMPPIPLSGSVAEAKERLVAIIRATPRTTIVSDEGDYLHVEFRSRIFRFVDDVEFLFDGEGGLLHFRSASRLGRGDMGVNRRRMEEVRSRFTAS